MEIFSHLFLQHAFCVGHSEKDELDSAREQALTVGALHPPYRLSCSAYLFILSAVIAIQILILCTGGLSYALSILLWRVSS